MSNPLDRPDGSGMSRTKLVALAALAVPVIQRYLEARGWQVDEQVVRDILIGLGALAAWYLRSGMKRKSGETPDLGRLFDGYEQAFRQRAELQETVRALEAANAELRARGEEKSP
jgi:hypothetical protein